MHPKEGHPPHRKTIDERREPRVLSLVAAIALFLFASLNMPALLGYSSIPAETLLTFSSFIALALSAAFVYQYLDRKNIDKFKISPPPHSLIQIREANIKDLQSTATTSIFSVAQARIFAFAVVKPRQFRQRVDESYELGRRTVLQRVSLEVQIPRSLLKTRNQTLAEDITEDIVYYFPVLMPNKSKFFDDFHVCDAGGQSLSVLTYREYLQLAAVVTRTFIAYSYGKRTLKSVPTIPAQAKQVELKALRLLAARHDSKGTAPDINLDPNWHREISPPPEDRNASNSKDLLKDFVKLLTTHYSIVVGIQPDDQGRALIVLEQTLIPDLKLKRQDRLKVMLGCRPVDLSVRLRNASTCHSYHLKVNAPEGLYLAAQEIIECSETLKKEAADTGIPLHYRFRRRLGQPHAHFYARFFPEPAPKENPGVRFTYHETPPGSLLRAAISALAAFALVWVVAVIGSHNPDAGTDAPLLFLAFPALAAAWLGFDPEQNRLLEGTLVSRLSLLGTIATSFFAAALFMFHKSFDHFPWWHTPRVLSFFWVSDVSWIVIFVAALSNFTCVVCYYIERTDFFMYLSSRQEESDVHQNG